MRALLGVIGGCSVFALVSSAFVSAIMACCADRMIPSAHGIPCALSGLFGCHLLTH